MGEEPHNEKCALFLLFLLKQLSYRYRLLDLLERDVSLAIWLEREVPKHLQLL